MHYEEKVINGALHCRSTPSGEWRLVTALNAAAVNSLLAMTSDQRMDAFSHFCTHCGDVNPRFQCWNDE